MKSEDTIGPLFYFFVGMVAVATLFSMLPELIKFALIIVSVFVAIAILYGIILAFGELIKWLKTW